MVKQDKGICSPFPIQRMCCDFKAKQIYSRLLGFAAIAGLFIVPEATPALGQFSTSATTQPILELQNQEELQQQALKITVRVSASDNRGSGTLLFRQGNLYTVITNAHVLVSGVPFEIQAPDGQSYSATLVESINLQGHDIALLQFQSNRNYKVASLAKVPKLAVEESVIAAGFPYDSNRPLVTAGKISLLPGKSLKAGYQIGYSNNIQQGMSGGPILNDRGQLVGINALSAYPILNTAYVFEDGSRPSEKQITEMRRSSWGVPIQILDKIAPQFLTKALASWIEPSLVSSESSKSVQTYCESTCTVSKRLGQSSLLAQKDSKDFYDRGKKRVEAQDFSGAVVEFTKAIELDPNSADTFGERGWAYSKLGQTDLAITDFTQAIKLAPNNTTYYFWRGATYLDERKYAEAAADLTQVLERRQPDTYSQSMVSIFYFYRGWAYKKIGKYDLSATDFSQVQKFPDEVSQAFLRDSYFARGDIFLIKGSLQLAVADWKKANELPPPENVSEGQKKVEQIARAITVRIEIRNSGNHKIDSGSGVIAARNGKDYYVVTNQHVVNSNSVDYWIVTSDRKEYLINRSSIKAQPGFDLAVVKFSSDQAYTIATFADYSISAATRNVFTSGWPFTFKENKWISTNGFMLPADFLIGSGLDSSFLSNGYEISYTNITYPGMSGGAVLDALGQVIGIQGREVGEKERKISWGLSMGIPINAFLRLSQSLGINPKWLKKSQSIPSSTEENLMLGYYPLSYSPDEHNVRARLLSEGSSKPESWFNLASRLFRVGSDKDFVNLVFGIAFKLQKREVTSEPDQKYDGLLASTLPLGFEETALKLLDKAISSNRKRFEAWSMKAYIFRGLNDSKQALAAINEALKLKSSNPGLLLQKGYLSSDLKRPKDAIAAYTQAINRYEQQYKQSKVIPYYVAHFYRMRAAAYRQAGDRTFAIQDLTRAVAINPYGGACQELSEIYLESGNPQSNQAVACSLDTKARTLEGNIGGGLPTYLRGTARLLEGKFDEAIALFNQSINEQQQSSSSTLIDALYASRGEAFLGLKKYEEALADFEQAIKLNPNKARQYKQRGLVRDRLGDKPGALADFERAIRIEPDDGEAYFYRSQVYAAKGDMPKALSDMQKAAELFKIKKDEINYQTALRIIQDWKQHSRPK